MDNLTTHDEKAIDPRPKMIKYEIQHRFPGSSPLEANTHM